MKKWIYLHLAVIGFYTLLTVWLTWPVALQATTHIPGEATWAFDESTFIWNMWWFKFSLLNLGQTPLETTYTFFPLGIRLTTYTFNLFNAAFGLPIQLALSLPLANNLTLLFSYVSSAYGTFLLVLYVLSQNQRKRAGHKRTILYLAAVAAGVVYAFSASRMMYVALGHYNFVTIQWFPFYTLFFLKTVREKTSFKLLFLTGLFAAFCLYAELTFSVFLLFLSLILFIGEWWIGRRTRTVISDPWAAPVTQLLKLALIGLAAFVLTAPFILAVLPDFLDPAYSQPGWGEGLKLSTDLVGLVTLTPLHPLSGVDWIAELRAVIEGTSRFSDANTLFLGYGILALALVGFLVQRSRAWVWLWAAVIFTLLSLGPLLTINGQNRFNLDGLEVTFPLPFAALHYVPILNANRVPNRFGIPLTLALAVLVGYGLVWLLGQAARMSPRQRSGLPVLALFLLALAGLMFDQYSVSLPMTDARIPDVYHQIGAEPEQFTIMQLPLGWRNSYGTLGAERTQLQYYQTAHQRPMLGGNTSRNPSFKFDYYASIPLFAAITEAELYRAVDEETLTQARAQAPELMTLYDIKYLIIHEPIPFRKPYEDTYQATRSLALDLIPHQPEPVYESPGVQVFAVQQAQVPNPLTIDFGEWTSTPYRGKGWAGNEEIFAATANWATASEAEVFFPVRSGGDRQLTIHLAPFSHPDLPPQQVELWLNEQPLVASFPLEDRWQTVDVPLPEALLVDGLNRLTLEFARTAQPRQVLPADRAVGSTGLETPVDLEVNSGAEFAFITAGFGEDAVDVSAHRRGVNVAVIKPESGEVVEFSGFDTAANEFEADALSEFINRIPEGYIVIIATQGLDAASFFSAETTAALETVGASTDSLTPPFSIIGVKGAAGGAALQAAGEGTAYLRLGANPDTRDLAAAVDKIVISD